MREIKFRFYPKNQITNFQGKTLQKMWEATSIDFEENEISNGGDIFSLNEVELMQYTWFKDKKWKEIYEGDILFSDKRKWMSWVNWYYKVEYSSFFWTFELFGSYPSDNDVVCEFTSKFFEVVWNIYENHDLLNN